MAKMFYLEFETHEDGDEGIKLFGPFMNLETLEREMFQMVRNCEVNIERQLGVVVPSFYNLMEKIGEIDFDGKLVRDEVKKAA